jgi:hypothetical protein
MRRVQINEQINYSIDLTQFLRLIPFIQNFNLFEGEYDLKKIVLERINYRNYRENLIQYSNDKLFIFLLAHYLFVVNLKETKSYLSYYLKILNTPEKLLLIDTIKGNISLNNFLFVLSTIDYIDINNKITYVSNKLKIKEPLTINVSSIFKELNEETILTIINYFIDENHISEDDAARFKKLLMNKRFNPNFKIRIGINKFVEFLYRIRNERDFNKHMFSAYLDICGIIIVNKQGKEKKLNQQIILNILTDQTNNFPNIRNKILLNLRLEQS